MANTRDLEVQKLFNVQDWICIVTGGGSGIGLVAAQALAANGARVYIVGRTESKLQRAVQYHGQSIRGSLVPLVGDVTCKDDIRRIYNHIEAIEPRIDVLINCAGRWSNSQASEGASAEEIKKNLFEPENATFDDWAYMFKVNAGQAYFMTTAFLPLLQRTVESFPSRHATVINITSVSGIVKTAESHFATNASKAAGIHLTKLLASEIAALGLKIRVNSIAPGVFPSEITAGTSDERGKSVLPDGYLSEISAGRTGNDQDMANAILFAATNMYLNGQVIVVDGGYLLHKGAL